jgi:hypothetical protein
MHVDSIRDASGWILPNVSEQVFASNDLARSLRQIFKHLEFPRKQFDSSTVPPNELIIGVDLERAYANSQRSLLADATHDRVNSRGELADCERFHQIVVRARTQSANAFIDRAQRAYDENRRDNPTCPHRFDDVERIFASERVRQNDKGEVFLQSGAEAVVFIPQDPDGKSATLQFAANFVGNRRVVLDDQDGPVRG